MLAPDKPWGYWLVGISLVQRGKAPQAIAECEINPLVVTASGPMALDILVTLSQELPAPDPPRPLHKIAKLLST